jgi:hypothetical protein
LRSLLHKHTPEGLDDDRDDPFFWDENVLAGRRFPQKVTNDEGPKVTKVKLPFLANIDKQAPQNETIKDLRVDACIISFIAIGLSNPQDVDLTL